MSTRSNYCFRIGWHYDADADGTVENTTDDPWYLFVYDERWRVVNTYRLADWSYSVSNPSAANSKERFVYHAAGLGGLGGSSYIDSVILRDRDMNTSWTAASDGTLEKRHYYCQNWRADVSAIITDTGKMVEWVKYSAYGVPYTFPSGDTDSDLDWDATDSAAMTGSYDVRKDADLDGDVDAADATHANSIKTGTGYQTLGRGVLSSTGVENRKSYAGYEYDPTFKGAGRVLMHVRHRVYDAELGRWGRRDPSGYFDGISLAAYASLQPISRADPIGLDDVKYYCDGFGYACSNPQTGDNETGVCCCCPKSLVVTSMVEDNNDDARIYGHTFRLEAQFWHVRAGGKKDKGCELEWWEKSNVPDPGFCGGRGWDGNWQDQVSACPNSLTFREWPPLMTPCPTLPGQEKRVHLDDTPRAYARDIERHLCIAVRVLPAPNCGCQQPTGPTTFFFYQQITIKNGKLEVLGAFWDSEPGWWAVSCGNPPW